MSFSRNMKRRRQKKKEKEKMLKQKQEEFEYEYRAPRKPMFSTAMPATSTYYENHTTALIMSDTFLPVVDTSSFRA